MHAHAPCRCEGPAPQARPLPTSAAPQAAALGPVDDPLEHEADRAAERVLAGETVQVGGGNPGGQVRRKPGGEAGGGGAGRAAGALASGGAALDPGLRSYFEPRFGRSFADVRLHTDAAAEAGARAIGARAYTLGSHIGFGRGEFSAGTGAGRRLIAHELAHVAQQGAEAVIRRDPLTVEQLRDMIAELELRAASRETIPPEELQAMTAERNSLLAQLQQLTRARVATRIPPRPPGAAQSPAPQLRTAAVPEASTMTPVEPADMVDLVVEQRAFSANGPTAEGGVAAIPEAALAPEVRGGPSGTGFQTNAAVQVIDADGNQIAFEMAQYGGSGEPHAEAQGVARLRLRLAGRRFPGGRMVVAVDQIACGGCMARLRALALELGLASFEVWTTGAGPGSRAGPKWAARTALQRPARGPGAAGGTGYRTQPRLAQGETLPVAPVDAAAPAAPPVAAPAEPAVAAPPAEAAGPRVEAPVVDTPPPEAAAAPRPAVEPVAPEAGPAVPRRGGGGGGGGPGVVGGLFGFFGPIAAGVIHGYAVRDRMRRQAQTEGYASPHGPSGQGLLYDIGSWFIDPGRDAERSVGLSDRFNITVWRNRARAGLNATPVGGTFTIGWDVGLCEFDLFGNQRSEHHSVTYRREADGRWTVVSGGNYGIDPARILSPSVSDADLMNQITANPCGSITA